MKAKLQQVFISACLLVLAACGDDASAPAPAQLELKGIKPSTTRAQMAGRLTECSFLRDPKGREVCGLDPASLGTIGRKPVKTAKVYFDDQIFGEMIVQIDADPVEMRDALAERYGAPPFENASLLGWSYSWLFEDGTLSLEQQSEVINGYTLPAKTLNLTITAKGYAERAATDRARDL